MRFFGVFLLLALVSALGAQPVSDEGSSDSPPEVAPLKTTVTVTGTRSPLEIENSPVSTSVVSREELEKRNIRQVDQALVLTEGVNALRSKGPSDNDFGLGLRGFAGRGGQSRTLILLDGQPVNNSYIGNVNWAAFSVSELERVEVARGPFSSLYGGNAMGGVVNMITRPVEKRHLEFLGQMGNRDSLNYSVRASDRYFGKLGLSVGYTRFQTGGYSPQETLRPASSGSAGTHVTGVVPWRTATGGNTFQVGERGRNWFNQQAWRGRAEYAFTQRLFASFQVLRQERSDGYDAYTTGLRGPDGSPFDNGAALFDDNGIQRRLTLTPANFIGTPTAASQTIYQGQVLANLTSKWNLRLAGGVMDSPGDWYVTPGSDASLSGGTGNWVNQANRSGYANAQASREGSGNHWVLGTETRLDQASIVGRTIPNYAIRANAGDVTSRAGGEAVNQAAYVQYQRTVLEGFHVVAGGRWDYWRTYDGSTQTGAGQTPTAFNDRSTNSFTGKIAAVYTLPGAFQVRGSVGNAFRNPSVYELYRDLSLGSALYLANPLVEPEKLLAYEVGLERGFTGGHRVEATYFVNRVRDLIYRTTDFAADPTGGIRRLTNAGQSRTRGLEVAAQQRALPWLMLRQTYTYTDAVITENPSLPDTVGRRLPYVPKHTLTYLATAAKARWSATWTGRYTGAVFSSDTNTDVVTGVPGSYNPFFEMDISASYRVTRQLSFIANADNLLDRRYYLYFLTPGRTVFAGLRWSY